MSGFDEFRERKLSDPAVREGYEAAGERWWEVEPITYRQHLVEQSIMSGVPWLMAIEAVSSTLLEHPEIDADEKKPRGAWTS